MLDLRHRHDPGVPPERAESGHARHVHQSHPCGPHGLQEHVPVPRLQDQVPRTHFRLDLQPQDQGEARQMGARRRGAIAASLIQNTNKI